MKLILALLLTLSLQADNVLLLSGFAWHSEKANEAGREYDVAIEGIGYQYRENGNSISVMLLNDSNSEFMPLLTVGTSYEINKYISAGAEVGVTSKKVFNNGIMEREILPLLFPKIEFNYGKYSMNVAYFYGIESNEMNTPHLVYVNFGVRF